MCVSFISYSGVRVRRAQEINQPVRPSLSGVGLGRAHETNGPTSLFSAKHKRPEATLSVPGRLIIRPYPQIFDSLRYHPRFDSSVLMQRVQGRDRQVLRIDLEESA
jgi:hypothetical protein